MDTFSILLLDDDKRSRSTFARSLQKKLDVTVDLHDNLLNAERAGAGKQYALACIDSMHSIPPLGDSIKRLTGDGPLRVPRILLLLKEYNLDRAVRAISSGCHGWICRPFYADLIEQKIRSILETGDSARHPLPSMRRPSFLVADGNERFRKLLVESIVPHNRLIEAVSGFDAAVAFSLYRPQTIVISSSLDGWSHERLIRNIRSDPNRPAPDIFVTVYDSSEQVTERLVGLGATGCIRKTSDIDLLKEILMSHSIIPAGQ